jgi:hypothetical protein
MNRLWKEIKQSSFCRSNETSYSVQSNVYIMKFLKTVVTITEYKKKNSRELLIHKCSSTFS